MLVIASAALDIVLVVVVVVLIGALAVVLGRRSPGDEIREDIEADQGPLGVGDIHPHPEHQERGGLYDEERLDRENE